MIVYQGLQVQKSESVEWAHLPNLVCSHFSTLKCPTGALRIPEHAMDQILLLVPICRETIKSALYIVSRIFKSIWGVELLLTLIYDNLHLSIDFVPCLTLLSVLLSVFLAPWPASHLPLPHPCLGLTIPLPLCLPLSLPLSVIRPLRPPVPMSLLLLVPLSIPLPLSLPLPSQLPQVHNWYRFVWFGPF